MSFSRAPSQLPAILIALLILLLDLSSKHLVVQSAGGDMQPREVCSFLNIVLVFNQGISFGMLSHHPARWIAFVLPAALWIIVLLLLVWLMRARQKQVIIALGCIIGGAVSNLIDRALKGSVTDFLDFHIGPYHWPAFNVADSAIFIGVVIFLFTNILADTNPEKEKEDDRS